MNKEQIVLVKRGFAKVERVAEEAAVLFYAKLFDISPELRPLFVTDIDKQGRKLMQMIATAVDGLDNIERITPLLRDLGARHVVYGVEEGHYDTVGKAFLWTLQRALGDDFTAADSEAWATVYSLIATSMKEGARAEATAASA